MSDIRGISTADLAALGDDITVIDVREPDEYAAGHIPNAVSLPMSQLLERVHEIPDGETAYLVCGAGGRSSRVIEALQARGWQGLVNVDGGTSGWINEGRPVVTE